MLGFRVLGKTNEATAVTLHPQIRSFGQDKCRVLVEGGKGGACMHRPVHYIWFATQVTDLGRSGRQFSHDK